MLARRPIRGETAGSMKIYTKTGDDGTTGILGPGRLRKDDPRIEAYGSVDELNAVLGVVRALQPIGNPDQFDPILEAIQSDLFTVGAALADPDPHGRFHQAIGQDQISKIEAWIDQFEASLPPLTQFILPGGTLAAALVHQARTVCRRAERRVVELSASPEGHVSADVLVYLNRLGDFLFVLARAINHQSGVPDQPWRGLGS